MVIVVTLGSYIAQFLGGHNQVTTFVDFDETWWKLFLQASRSFVNPRGATQKQKHRTNNKLRVELLKSGRKRSPRRLISYRGANNEYRGGPGGLVLVSVVSGTFFLLFFISSFLS